MRALAEACHQISGDMGWDTRTKNSRTCRPQDYPRGASPRHIAMLSVHDTQSLDPACHNVLQRDVDEKQPHFVLTTTTSASGKILKTAQRRPATTLRSCPRRFQLMVHAAGHKNHLVKLNSPLGASGKCDAAPPPRRPTSATAP